MVKYAGYIKGGDNVGSDFRIDIRMFQKPDQCRNRLAMHFLVQMPCYRCRVLAQVLRDHFPSQPYAFAVCENTRPACMISRALFPDRICSSETA